MSMFESSLGVYELRSYEDGTSHSASIDKTTLVDVQLSLDNIVNALVQNILKDLILWDRRQIV